MSITVRDVTPEDEAAWRALWHDYLVFYRTELPEAVYRLTWSRILDPEIRMHAALARDADGRALGLVNWLYHLQFWEERARIYLNDLYVSSDARGLGAGRALIEHVYADADTSGATVYWTTEEDNHTARRLYDGIGTLTPFIKYTR